jgi:hypothetical protein
MYLLPNHPVNTDVSEEPANSISSVEDIDGVAAVQTVQTVQFLKLRWTVGATFHTFKTCVAITTVHYR